MEKVVKKHLHTDGYALDEIAQHVGLDLCWIHVPVDTTTSLLFLLHERCRHVYYDTAKGLSI